MINTHIYCPDCHKTIPDAEIKWGYILPEQKYGDNAHPAEYDEPCCPYCGAELTEGEECELCEEVFEPEKLVKGLCVNCRAFRLVEDLIDKKRAEIISQIIDEYGVSIEEACSIFNEQLREYAE